ncbi:MULTISPECIES: DNA repair protein RecO [Petrimonas]|jgi:DNA repair protein RecO (recombination protein O)|uniref:DNA repair protein RecO n=3 Tax=Petrimonas mucosa TaxID=1642646 RepID=A0A1G4G7R0_9BACT|nr:MULTISPECIES: DNA repair protein RecO C-terminal domain-containing protein [Petrimonas]MDD3560151.1 DNA repair protein RecO C-terminal domain-containing protein [Petrimonas mucosa]SCM58333.1 DNA repair protein RecO {ECO:0000255/HAMAP-Rule:MF_00201} [Petrimonas mucosa]SFU27834.1 DNA replication and repair protein RecO [Porphyromonadaceae bacterium KHP3R9]HHT29386.1 DNA repair protein RecO [Petrimonas mucosa]
MLYKTEGIVLSNAGYNDKYAITHLFTRDFGPVSYLLPKTRGRRSKINTALFTPLSILNMEVEHLPLRDIQRLKEVDRQTLLFEIGSNPVKVSLTLFLSEFLSKVLRETDNNEVLFDYLKQAIEVLERTKRGLANFHLTFLLGLTRFLGIYPNLENYTRGCYFDMLNGEFTYRSPTHQYLLNERESAYLHLLTRINFSNMHLFRLSRNDRNLIIDRLLTYYRLHLYDFQSIRSLEVLRELH